MGALFDECGCRAAAHDSDEPRQHRGLCARLSISLALVDEVTADGPVTLPDLTPDRRAMIVFTSGTTSKPKGAVTTHGNIAAQISTLIDAWAWQPEDVIPLFLPLHHVHGIINVLSCALWAGATVHVMPKLDLGQLCRQLPMMFSACLWRSPQSM